MKNKKNPKADLSRWSSVFMLAGLALMLLIAWQAIEWKTYDKENVDIGQLNVSDDLLEDVPITQNFVQPPPPPPPPPPAPEIIEVVEDEVEIKETIIKSTETAPEQKIVEVKDVVEAPVEEEIRDVPFAIIENVPVYPGCEKMGSNDAKKKCMSEKIKAFVGKKFDTGLAAELGLEGRIRITVLFKIDKNGDVVNVQARAPNPRLEQEAKDVVSALPKMTPGKQRGKAVGVLYSLPILFDVQ